MRAEWQILGVIAVLGLLIGYPFISEIYYARSILPRNISTVRDFFDRFGEPRHIRMVQRDGQSYYEFMGQLPAGFVFAIPSAPPAYILDEQGRFVGWCRDPGDAPSHRRTWPLRSTNEVEIGVIRQKFGL